jgi:ssDNA-binding replication factor A large subunit
VLSIEDAGKKILVQVGDETGTVLAYLEPDRRIKLGHTIALLNNEVNLYHHHIQLRNGTVSRVNVEINAVNTANNISALKW